MISKIKKSLLIVFASLQIALSFAIILPAVATNAQTLTPPTSCRDGFDDPLLGIPKWYVYLDGELDGTGRCSPTIKSSADALPIGLAVLEGMLTIGGYIAVAFVFVGSYKYIVSVGNPEKTTGARRTIQNSLIGLVIVIVSTGVISFVGGRLIATT